MIVHNIKKMILCLWNQYTYEKKKKLCIWKACLTVHEICTIVHVITIENGCEGQLMHEKKTYMLVKPRYMVVHPKKVK